MGDTKYPLWLQKGHTAVYYTGIGIVVGLMLGYLIGALLFSFDAAMSIVVGAALGLIVGAVLDVWAYQHGAPER